MKTYLGKTIISTFIKTPAVVIKENDIFVIVKYKCNGKVRKLLQGSFQSHRTIIK